MNIPPLVRSPFAPTSAARRATPVATGDLSSAPTDGYAGTIASSAARSAAPPQKSMGFARRLAVVGMGALALIGVVGATAVHAAPLAPQISQSATQQSPWSNPGRAVPDNAAQVDDTAWISTFQDAFKAVKSGDAQGFLNTLSSDGVWVRGLPEAPKTESGMLYMTHDEVAKDLHDHGAFYKHVFTQHDNARFVVTPDAHGKVQTILLN